MRRRQLVQLTAAALAAPSLSAFAQSFPARPIKLLVAFPAGGPTDITMRQLADNASRVLGQPVVVENKPGAGGTLPAQQLQWRNRTADSLVAEALAPDGLVEGVRVDGAQAFAFGVQWHPEWRHEANAFYARTLEAFAQACTAHRRRRQTA